MDRPPALRVRRRPAGRRPGERGTGWFAKAVEADRDGSTDASDRLAELDGVEFVDALAEDGADEAGEAGDAEESDRSAGDSAEDGDKD